MSSSTAPTTNTSSNSGTTSNLSDLFCERETQYFGLTPYAFLDSVGQIIIDNYFRSLGGLVSESLPTACPFLSENQIGAAMTQWTLLAERTIDKNYELFEMYVLKNVLAMPAGFPYDEDVCGPNAADDAELAKLDQEMLEQMRRLKKATVINRQLKLQQLQSSQDEAVLLQLEEHLSTIKHLMQAHKVDSLERSISDFIDQIQQLKSIVTETLHVGSNYLFAKFDADQYGNLADPSTASKENGTNQANNTVERDDANYRKLLAEMAGVGHNEIGDESGKWKSIKSELSEKLAIGSLDDFNSLRSIIRSQLNQQLVH